MKIEAGRFYKTRDGRKAYVVVIHSPFSNAVWPVCGYLEGSQCAVSWRNDGHCYGRSPSDNDIVAEWKEPERRTAKVYLARSISGEVFATTITPNIILGSKIVELVEGVFE